MVNKDLKKEGWKQVSRPEANVHSMEHLGKGSFELQVLDPEKGDIDFHDTTTLNPIRKSYWIRWKK